MFGTKSSFGKCFNIRSAVRELYSRNVVGSTMDVGGRCAGVEVQRSGGVVEVQGGDGTVEEQGGGEEARWAILCQTNQRGPPSHNIATWQQMQETVSDCGQTVVRLWQTVVRLCQTVVMDHTLCTMHYAPCTMHHAPCMHGKS